MAFRSKRVKPMKRKIDLTSGSILKKLLIVAIPVLLTSFVQMTYNLTDMFWLGRTPDSVDSVAAIGTAGFYPWFGMGLIMITKVGVSVYISQAAGRNDREAVNRIATNGVFLMAFFGILYTIFGVFFNDIYVGIFRINNDTVVTYAQNYLRIVSSFGLMLFMVNLFNGVYDGLGKTINTFYISASGLVLNMILDPIFILGFGWGVEGAALATGIAQTSIIIIYLVIYLSKKRPASINPKKYLSWFDIRKIFKLGIPVGIQSMMMTVISVIIGVFVARLGSNIIAVSRIGSQIEALSWMIASGFQVALAAFVGQNLGANQMGRVKAGYIMSMKLLVPYGIAINIILFVFAEQIFGIFINEPATLRAGTVYLEIVALSQLFMILELTTAGAFNGLGKTIVPALIGMLGNLLRLPFAYLASINHSAEGIWWTISLSSVFKGTILVILFVLYLIYLSKKTPQTVLVEKHQAL